MSTVHAQAGRQEPVHSLRKIEMTTEPLEDSADAVQVGCPASVLSLDEECATNESKCFAGEAKLVEPFPFIGVKVESCDSAVMKEERKDAVRVEEEELSSLDVAEPPTDGPHRCGVCGGSFLQLSAHSCEDQDQEQRHQLFRCDVCGRDFTRKENLGTHIQTHTGDRPHACDQCHARFTSKGNLQRHMRTHLGGQRKYKCEVCCKAFTEREPLKIHCRTHSGEKPYSCGTCGKAFAHRANLHKHVRVHTAARPYKCDVCTRGFSELSNMRRHRRTHSGDRPYTCVVCGRRFCLSDHLKRHHTVHCR